ncbi:MAG: DNA-binding protein [Opitutaceae bacterium]|nr:DNA-binding protein [Opitutaceae bacterium]
MSSSYSGPWSAWADFPDSFRIDPSTLGEILDGGQAFRWRAGNVENHWTGQWDRCLVMIRLNRDGRPQWRSPLVEGQPLCTRGQVETYLGFDRDWDAIVNALPWRSDPHLTRCLPEFPGLRILRQPLAETLLGFLCSATKQIVQIKQMMALLAQRHGAQVLPGIHRLPTWPEIAAASEKELRACLLGFRARYIHETAIFLNANPGWLEETGKAGYSVAKERLCQLPGVGEKVADCVLLYGAGKLEAFPVDVWILRTLELRYGLNGWKPSQLAQFGRIHFGEYAGAAQQFLFAWERRQKRILKPG